MKKAIIVGATSGLGRSVALGLLKEGYMIGIAGRREELLEEIRKTDPEHIRTKTIDVNSTDAPARLLSLINEMGGIDLYFHSSGYGKQNISLDLETERQTVMTNCLGFTQMIITAFNYFKETKRRGQIAVISSIAGTKGLGAAPSYSATKRFDWIYLESLAQNARMNHLDIKFTDIRPGFVDTDFIKDSNFPMKMSCDYVANHIVKAVLKQKRKVTIDWRYRILCFFWRLIPDALWEKMNVK